jgi:S-adenosylmethionine-diacylglycerol 3-amino-3-carboxypropyl transferase
MKSLNITADAFPDHDLSVVKRLACDGFDEAIRPTFEIYKRISRLDKTPETVNWERFCNRINYSACNENSYAEIEVLKPAPGKKLLCITAGGGRVLDLLTGNPSEIWAVDLNLNQSYLFELKIAAMKALNFEDYCEFLGDRHSDDRKALFSKVEKFLSKEAIDFYLARPEILKKGILYQGNLERFFSLTSRIFSVLWSKNRRKLFNFSNIEDQKQFLDKHWNKSLTKGLLKNFFRRPTIELFVNDPGFMNYLPEGVKINERIFGGIDRYLENNLANNNHLLTMIFFGNYKFEGKKPLYLQKEFFYKIKEALNTTKIKIITGYLYDVLKSCPAGTFDGFSISDISSYMNDEAIEMHFDEIVRTSKPGAKIAARFCLAQRNFHTKFAHLIKRDKTLESNLAKQDYSMVHEFLAGEVL